ncbi:MAG: SAM hydroxide adenosyltransferase [Actinomycetota bacterium]
MAAHLCNGGVLEDVGEEIDTALVMPGIVPVASRESHPRHGEGLRCEVTWVDTFGNCQLNAGVEDIESFGSQLRLVIPGGTEETIRSARVATHFAVIGDGAVGLVIDSYGMLAVAVDRGSAAAQLSLGAGDAVLLFAGEDRGPEAPVTLRTTR